MKNVLIVNVPCVMWVCVCVCVGLYVCVCVCVLTGVSLQAYACGAVSHWSQNLSPVLSQSPASSSQSNKEACFKNAWNCHKKCSYMCLCIKEKAGYSKYVFVSL